MHTLVAEGKTQRSPKQSHDDYVVTCAARLFLERGIETVKMVDIAKEAQVGVATLYRHFSSKTRIAVQVASLVWENFNQSLLELIESDSFLVLDGISRMRVLLEAYCESYCEHGDFVRFLDEFDRLVVVGAMQKDELSEYGTQLDSFYPIFEDAYLLGRQDGSIARAVQFRQFYLALAHALMGVAQKLNRGEIIPSDDFSSAREELQSIVNMALWSLVASTPVPEVPVSAHTKG